jgi:phosphoglycolate phosphatase
VFKVVIFDYDGTLFDTRPAIVHCLARALMESRRTVPASHAIAAAVRSGLDLTDTLLLLDRDLYSDRGALDELVVTYRQIYRDEGTPLLRSFPETAETLRQLQRGGAKCIVVSNKGIEAIRRSLGESGLSPLIDLVFADQQGLPKKPDPAIVTELILPSCDRLRREEIVVVGDTEIDILFAKRAGISCCWAAYGYGDPERCRKLAPDYEISAIADVAGIVWRLAPANAGRIA